MDSYTYISYVHPLDAVKMICNGRWERVTRWELRAFELKKTQIKSHQSNITNKNVST